MGSLHAHSTGAPDPLLLARVNQVLAWLPAIATETTARVGTGWDDENIDPERGPL